MTAIYPDELPCPLIDGYQIDIDAGVIRSAQRGFPQQRRPINTMPHSIKCRFALTIKEWSSWQAWFTYEGKGWFYLNLPTGYAGHMQQPVAPLLVRLISQVTIEARSHTHVIASVTLGVAPSMFADVLENA